MKQNKKNPKQPPTPPKPKPNKHPHPPNPPPWKLPCDDTKSMSYTWTRVKAWLYLAINLKLFFWMNVSEGNRTAYAWYSSYECIISSWTTFGQLNSLRGETYLTHCILHFGHLAEVPLLTMISVWFFFFPPRLLPVCSWIKHKQNKAILVCSGALSKNRAFWAREQGRSLF